MVAQLREGVATAFSVSCRRGMASEERPSSALRNKREGKMRESTKRKKRTKEKRSQAPAQHGAVHVVQIVGHGLLQRVVQALCELLWGALRQLAGLLNPCAPHHVAGGGGGGALNDSGDGR